MAARASRWQHSGICCSLTSSLLQQQAAQSATPNSYTFQSCKIPTNLVFSPPQLPSTLPSNTGMGCSKNRDQGAAHLQRSWQKSQNALSERRRHHKMEVMEVLSTYCYKPEQRDRVKGGIIRFCFAWVLTPIFKHQIRYCEYLIISVGRKYFYQFLPFYLVLPPARQQRMCRS